MNFGMNASFVRGDISLGGCHRREIGLEGPYDPQGAKWTG
jgi:hypothetical protein